MYHEGRTLVDHKVDEPRGERLVANEPRELAKDEYIGISATSEQFNLGQEFIAQVSAGSSNFSIIRAKNHEDDEIFLVAKQDEGQRATIIATLHKGDYVSIGRQEQKELGGDKQLSRTHFTVAALDDGGIGIMDHGSTNGTALQTQKNYDGDRDSLEWSVKSQEVHDLLTGTHEYETLKESELDLGYAASERDIRQNAAYWRDKGFFARLEGATAQVKEKIDAIIRTKGIGSEEVRSGAAELSVRFFMANTYLKSPSTYEALEQGEVAGFHGTQSMALAGILESGALKSAAVVNQKMGASRTGEHVYQSESGQASISFSNLDHINDAVRYSGSSNESITQEQAVLKIHEEIAKLEELAANSEEGKTKNILLRRVAHAREALNAIQNNPDSIQAVLERERFPVLLGINGPFARSVNDGKKHAPYLYGASNMGEFRPQTNEVPISALPVVAVPQDRIAFVESLFRSYGYDNIKVVPITDIT
jgi:pSer/pThr/pTyr-binding forkhead associated (FHA) protein